MDPITFGLLAVAALVAVKLFFFKPAQPGTKPSSGPEAAGGVTVDTNQPPGLPAWQAAIVSEVFQEHHKQRQRQEVIDLANEALGAQASETE